MRAQIRDFLTGQNIELMGHPSYSPDLVSRNFFSFPHIKKKKYAVNKDAVEMFKNHVLGLSQSEWKKCFNNWFKRM